MGKTLIFMKTGDIKPIGGPAGYLYNLKKQLEKSHVNDIEFISEKTARNRLYKYYERMPLKFKKIYQSYVRRKNCRDFTNQDKKRFSSIDISQFDVIHFHSTRDLFSVKDSLTEYKGKIVLTSHTPKPAFMEYRDDILSEKDRKVLGETVNKLENIDIFAFNRADYIVFPSPDAEEPYFNNWPLYNDIHTNNKHKYRYLLSGIQPGKPRMDRVEVCKRYGVPEDSFIISFVGRHNETKGYDALKIMGENILRQNEKVYFLIAGTETPLKGLKNNRWIEAGWTNDPHSLIAASDVFVLPNKETYFDLVMLETLSLGVPVLASETGGNKHFKKYEDTGIFLYKTIDEAVLKLMNLCEESPENMLEFRGKNKELFNLHFTAEIFARNYQRLLDELKEDK